MSKPPNATTRSSSLRWVPLADMHVDSRAQRPAQQGAAWVRAHTKDFDPDQIGYIVVNKRSDGKWFVIDGQNRKALLEAVGWGDQQVQCEAFEGLTLAQEAEVFLHRNRDRRAVRTFDNFRVAITAGETAPCDIDRIVRAQGLAISDQEREGHICAVNALERVYRGAGVSAKDGPAALARTLRLVQRAWGRQPSSFNGKIIEGIGLAQLRYNGKIDQEALASKLAPLPGGAPGLIGRAQQLRDIRGAALASCVAGVVVDIYNKGRKKGKGALEDWWS